MRLPEPQRSISDWPHRSLEGWERITTRARERESEAGINDAFEAMVEMLRDAARLGRIGSLDNLLQRRLAARALTWLWLRDEAVRARLLKPRVLEALVHAQRSRLTRMTLLQLVQLYFREFDRLDGGTEGARAGLRDSLESLLKEQSAALPASKLRINRPDALSSLRMEAGWLLTANGPAELARRVRQRGDELAAAFRDLGLGGLDGGRYGDVARGHFYLETLRGLAPGAWDPVLDELAKPAVSRAPFEGTRRIGHAALEIMIDRAGDDPGSKWQNFILELAGDPRIASSAPHYREWWVPLGEARIGRVRGWLSKEDLRLFLTALQQYGKETRNEDLQRMFPARKLFLEGLHKLGLIRYSRLMLGGLAHQSMRRILGEEMRTTFARMDGTMNDKAVIYLDCGDFHIVEGSHSFKIWLYLAQPGPWIKSYDRNSFSHRDLTVTLPRQYQDANPRLAHLGVTHNGLWQQKVFEFLGDNGIGMDVENLLTRQDYRELLERFGMPVVRPRRGRPTPAPRADSGNAMNYGGLEKTSIADVSRSPSGEGVSLEAADTRYGAILNRLSLLERDILRYFAANPGDRARQAANVLKIDARTINQLLYGKLRRFCEPNLNTGWSVEAGLAHAVLRRYEDS